MQSLYVQLQKKIAYTNIRHCLRLIVPLAEGGPFFAAAWKVGLS